MWHDELAQWVTNRLPQWSGGWDAMSPLMVSPHRVRVSAREWDIMTQLAVCLDGVLSQSAPSHIPHLSPPLSSPPLSSPPLSSPPLSTSPLSTSPLSTSPLSTSPLSSPPLSWGAVPWPAVFTSYDFYVTDQGPQLIEVNTNAAGLPLVGVLSAYYGHGECDAAIRTMINSMGPGRIAIVDDQPRAQKTYFEFEMIAHWLRVQGWDPAIYDVRDPGIESADWVYNRFCDFEWRTPASEGLRACDQRGIRISPHPWHYVTLAHKARLVGLRALVSPDWWPYVPETRWLSDCTKDEWWAQRRGLFFKPASGFGSRGVYRGDGMSRKVMAAMSPDTVVQPFLIPREVMTPDGPFKADVRVYVHQGVVVAVGGRLFRGQVTNAQTMGGGFALVETDTDGRVV